MIIFIEDAIFLDKPRTLLYNDCTQKYLTHKSTRKVKAVLMVSVWFLLAMGGTMGVAALLAFLWGVKNGAFENAEDAKYIVFRDEDDE